MVTNTSSTPAPLHPPCGNARRTAWRAWWHWTVMVALGEVLGADTFHHFSPTSRRAVR